MGWVQSSAIAQGWIHPGVCADTDRDLCRVLHPDQSHNPFYSVSLNLQSIGTVIVFHTAFLSLFLTPRIFLNWIKWLDSNLTCKDISFTNSRSQSGNSVAFCFLHSDFRCIYKESTALFFNLFKPLNLLISQQFVNVN